MVQESRSSTDPTYAHYASLDPENLHWDSFEQRLNVICSEDPEDVITSRDEDHAPLKKKLSDARLLGPLDLRAALHFAFIDHVIARGAVNDHGKLRQYADLRFPTEWYATARTLQREIHLHVGPTNSGKTYNALKRLEESGSGFYAGPLRLLAHEVYSRFRAKGTACDLITGDDVRIDELGKASLTSSTVEMVDTGNPVDVAVIDEIQMMADMERGWAWTRAFLGVNAKEVHLCGETRVVPLIRELAASMGDTLHVHQYERLNPLQAMSKSLRGNLKSLRNGDCIVCFSVLGIHAMKKQIEKDTGRRVAIVYGSLPPETRAQQAALFNDPDNDYDFLVASDAIGMGLNLSIKRIIFESIWKSNGISKVKLTIPQLKQIAGRAGRYRTAAQATDKEETSYNSDAQVVSPSRVTQYRATTSVGLVTCLDEEDLSYIQMALRAEAEPLKHAAILPPAEFVDEFASHMPKGIPFEYVLRRLNEVAVLHPRYVLCGIKDQVKIAKHLESVRDLSIVTRYIFAAAPIDTKSFVMQRVLKELGKCVADLKMVTIADVDAIPLEVLEKPLSNERSYLEGLETLHKALILYLWLSYRFVNVFKDREMAMHAKILCEEKINRTLLEFSANPKLRKRLEQLQKSSSSDSEGSKSPNDLSGKDLIVAQDTSDNSSTTGSMSDESAKQPSFTNDEGVTEPVLPIDWAKSGPLNDDVALSAKDEARPASAHG